MFEYECFVTIESSGGTAVSAVQTGGAPVPPTRKINRDGPRACTGIVGPVGPRMEVPVRRFRWSKGAMLPHGPKRAWRHGLTPTNNRELQRPTPNYQSCRNHHSQVMPPRLWRARGRRFRGRRSLPRPGGDLLLPFALGGLSSLVYLRCQIAVGLGHGQLEKIG